MAGGSTDATSRPMHLALPSLAARHRAGRSPLCRASRSSERDHVAIVRGGPARSTPFAATATPHRSLIWLRLSRSVYPRRREADSACPPFWHRAHAALRAVLARSTPIARCSLPVYKFGLCVVRSSALSPGPQFDRPQAPCGAAFAPSWFKSPTRGCANWDPQFRIAGYLDSRIIEGDSRFWSSPRRMLLRLGRCRCQWQAAA